MKNYNEVAESVFRRSEEVIKQNNKRRQTLIAIGSAASCLVIAGTAGFAVWRNSVRGADAVLSSGQFANDNVNHSAEDDTVSVRNHVNATHEDIKASADDGIVGTVPDPNIPPDYPTLDGENNFYGGNGNINGIGTDSPGAAASGDTDSFGVSYPDTPNPPDTPNFAVSSSEPAQVPPEDNTPWTQGTPMCSQPVVNIIDSYSRISSSAYDAPANGIVYLSAPLKGAIAECADTNDDCRFYVTVDFYRDGECMDNSSESYKMECDRLSGHGFDWSYDTCGANEHHLSMLLSREQLESFPAGGYGYTLCLMGECNSSCVHSHCVQHAQNQADQVFTSSQGGHHYENHGEHHSNGHH